MNKTKHKTYKWLFTNDTELAIKIPGTCIAIPITDLKWDEVLGPFIKRITSE